MLVDSTTADDSNTISTLVVLGNGSLSSALVSMDHEWSAQGWQMTDDDDCGREDLGRLAMSCAFANGSDVIYLFGSMTREPEAVATALPSQVTDLLIFCPLVPLRKTQHGFQGLTVQEWNTLIVPDAVPGQPTIMSSFANKGGEEDDIEDDQQSLDSGSIDDGCWSDDSGDDDERAATTLPADQAVVEEDLDEENDSEENEDEFSVDEGGSEDD